MKRWKVAACLGALGFSLFLAVATPGWAQTAPTVAPNANVPSGAWQMPLVTPDQAAQMLNSRVVAPSSIPAPSAKTSAGFEAPKSLNVEPLLGHDLPTSPTAPDGTPRADFAIAKPDAKKRQNVAGGAVIGARKPDTAIIRQEPPTIGKP